MKHHYAKKVGLALVALALGLTAGCGGESGGLPSGIGASLQGVRLRASILTLGLNSNTSIDGELPENVVTGVSQSSTSANSVTQLVRIVLKSAGIGQQDVTVDLPYANPDNSSDFPKHDKADFPPQEDVSVKAGVSRIRCYIYPDPNLQNSGDQRPILVRRNPDSDGFVLVDSGNVSASRRTAINSYLTKLNGNITEQNKLVKDGVKTVLYAPNDSVPLRTGTFDTSVEFYDTPTPQNPFFVSFLKDAVTIEPGKEAQLTTAADSNPFDPGQRFAQPVEGKVSLQSVPANIRTLRVRVAEINGANQATTVYERIISQSSAFPDGQQTIFFLNRLRKVAIQVEGFIGDASGKPKDVSAGPPIVVGRLFTDGEGKTLTPELKNVEFGTMKMAPRITDGVLTAYSNQAKDKDGEDQPFAVPPRGSIDIAIYANLAVDTPTEDNPSAIKLDGKKLNPGPFEFINSTQIDIPATDNFVTAPSSVSVKTTDGQEREITIVKGQNLKLSTNAYAIDTNKGTFDLMVKGLIPVKNDGTKDIALGVDVKIVTSGTLPVTANVKLGDSVLELAGSIVVTASEASGIDTRITQQRTLTPADLSSDSATVIFNFVDQSFLYDIKAEAFSGPNGTGILLGKASTSKPVKLKTANDLILEKKGYKATDSRISSVSVAGTTLATESGQKTATLIQGKAYPLDISLLAEGKRTNAGFSLFDVSIPASSQGYFTFQDGKIAVTDTDSLETVTGSFTLTFKFSGSTPITQTFYVTIKPGSGDVGGGVG